MVNQVLSPLSSTQRTFHGERETHDQSEEPLSLPAEQGYGYYPSAVVGHRLGQYEIVRKLGWARSSSVWLCVDMASPYKKYVALKILSAHATACIVGGLSAEYTVFRRIESANPRHPGFSHCLTLQRCFTAFSSAGGHICFVTDVLGPNMRTLLNQFNQIFPVFVAKRIIKQILRATDYLHRECGYVHTDIKADNVLATLPDAIVQQIDTYLQNNKSAKYDKLKPSPQSIKSRPLPEFDLDLSHLEVRLIDYGEASSIDKHSHDDHCQADIIRAPEVTLGCSWSTPIDIWSIGCLAFELTTNFHLFGQDDTYSADVHLQNMVEYLGPFPPQFLKACTRRNDYFDNDGSLLRVTDFTPSNLEDVIYGIGAVKVGEVPSLAAFIRRCLALDPSSRPTALDLLNDKWLEGV